MSLSDVAAFKAELSHKADSYAAGTHLSGAIDTAGYHQALVVYNAGTTAGAGTTDITVEAATTSGGSYTAVSGAAFAQVTTANDEAVYVGRVNLTGTDRYLKVKAVQGGGAAAEFAVTMILTPYYSGDGSTFSFEV
jgi:hypothetical protein